MMEILKKYKILTCLTLMAFLYLGINISVSAKYDMYEEDADSMTIDTIAYQPSFKYKFAKAVPNAIMGNDSLLYPFFDKLSSLRKSSNDSVRTVSVVHIGDSHIQADFFTGTTRKLINHYFGNPGRGLIAPNKLMKSNNGRHYKITSTTKQWKYSFIVKPNEIPIGITGMGLQTNDSAANVNILTVDESFPGEWDFNEITTYCDIAKTDVYLSQSTVIKTDVYPFAKSFLLDSLTNNAEINFVSEENEISISGFNLSNGKRGVFYHSIGVNGARFCNYNQCAEGFYNQLASLNPELVIISMGTNEAMSRTIDEPQLYSDISDLVFFIRHSSPNTFVMLTTPAETYTRNRRGPNPQIEKVRNIIVNFAEKNGYPYWDLYNITGGKSSSLEWTKKGLLTRDRIHLTQRGYEYQGELLFEAIVKSYNQYLKAQI
ncbi:MAG: GDSL-type esterase/lipase family protein [Prevotellaceae bacterium]|jgi:hypothetical protein|nr:GDSL-type esterase/lipase family protein [Prevotellaceae bacterium]